MDALGLVVLDDQIFISKVVKRGTEQGIFTRDRADEIIRVSVAMANKYVLHKEVDFRSTEELAGVQETILKLVGVGLEIRSGGDLDKGLRILMEDSPVDLFRLAYTRIWKLRHAWGMLLQDHRIEILVSPEEFECLDEVTCQQLSQISVFSEAEIQQISSLTLTDRMFSSLAVLEYYESELKRYNFILKLKEILPFGLLNKSRSVRVEGLAEVDCLRDALVHTLIVSGCVGSRDPVAVSTHDVRAFLAELGTAQSPGEIPEKVEEVLLDLIQELAEGLDEENQELLTKEIVRIAENFLETIMNEWDTVTSPVETTFFKRWSRLVILSDIPDPVRRILSSDQPVDEFEFEVLLDQLNSRSTDAARELALNMPWERLKPDQIIRLFHDAGAHHEALAAKCSLAGFNAAELVDLVEVLSPEGLHALLSELKRAFTEAAFSMEDLEILACLHQREISVLLRCAGPPVDYAPTQILSEFGDLGEVGRRVFLLTGWRESYFPELVEEAWSISPESVKRMIKSLTPA
ncbi:MAG: DUF6178 family protein, partial [Desulfomonile sp.]|nr:DUF6178 family protein [Desulfomonile sp.]